MRPSLLLRTTVAAVLALTATACTPSDGPDPKAPLPVLSKKSAEQRARQLTETMAQAAGGKATPRGTRPAAFSGCVGRNGETADDGRFDLQYGAAMAMPAGEQARAARKIRSALAKDGYRVAGYRNDPKAKPAVLLDMTNDRTAYAVSAETAGDSAQHMVLRVNLPCHLPPGTKQQQF
ncbi:hypothetical protein ACWHA1_41675 [Streptomyces decoyicus]